MTLALKAPWFYVWAAGNNSIINESWLQIYLGIEFNNDVGNWKCLLLCGAASTQCVSTADLLIFNEMDQSMKHKHKYWCDCNARLWMSQLIHPELSWASSWVVVVFNVSDVALRTAVCSVPPVRPSTGRKPARSLLGRWSTTWFLILYLDTPTPRLYGSSMTFLLGYRYIQLIW